MAATSPWTMGLGTKVPTTDMLENRSGAPMVGGMYMAADMPAARLGNFTVRQAFLAVFRERSVLQFGKISLSRPDWRRRWTTLRLVS